MKSVRKAVFPVAGLGSRFLPATKANPKEMLPVVDKPLIQYAVEEAVAAGCTDLIFITGRTKRSIADHFDKAYELEHELEMKKKHDLLALCNTVPKHVNCIYILKQMTDIFDRFGRSILGVQQVPRSQTGSYGIVSTDADVGGLYGVTGIVEKPKPEVAPSTLAVVGRYVLTPRIFDHLRAITPGAGGELQLTDAIAALLKEEAVLAYPFKGTRYDCGSKLGYLQATVALARKHPEVGAAFTAWMDAQEVSREEISREADAA